MNPQPTGIRLAFDLHDFGVAMMRQKLRRRYPRASDDEIDEWLSDWLRDKPSLEGPDLVVTWHVPPRGG